ncbi:MAG: NUDIX domain-containing protein [Fermentimonas sp.]|nr:NUDIX domain-containing protein [Fermentimonas sp.]MDD4010208.1 NUDIX domain-containing protein [Fermentimonas sp.]MDD4698223.1 NUDIX domain-containing protein [Fermentimonas sp.]
MNRVQSVLYPYVSVDCVVFGFDGERLKVLLIERNMNNSSEGLSDKKLPGSIIYENEDLNTAAVRVLHELTGLKNIYLSQFHSFGNPERSNNPRDKQWLERTTKLKIGRLVTVGYVALIKISRKIIFESESTTARWYDIKSLNTFQLAFDHNKVALEALNYIRNKVKYETYTLFELLPQKFTMTQLRNLYDIILETKSDVRNFQKKMLQVEGLEQLDEFQKDVPYRAPRLYRYNKRKGAAPSK